MNNVNRFVLLGDLFQQTHMWSSFSYFVHCHVGHTLTSFVASVLSNVGFLFPLGIHPFRGKSHVSSC